MRLRLKRVVLYFVLWVVVPLLFLGIIEAGLRLSGYGYTCEPFLKKRVGETVYRQLNVAFLHTFMPRLFDPKRLPASETYVPEPRAANTVRIVVLGESAAYGYVHPEFSLWRFLQVMLEKQYLSLHIEVYPFAFNSMNSHVMRHLVDASEDLDIDVFVAYMGNNEFKGALLGPLYALSRNGWSADATQRLVSAYLWLSNLRLWQLARRVNSFENTLSWNQEAVVSRIDDPRLHSIYSIFRQNLEYICTQAKNRGSNVLLCTVGRNLRDFPPRTSAHDPGLTPASLQEWTRHFETGARLEAAGSYGEALGAYRAAVALDEMNAELHYRMGACLYALGAYAEARDHFVQSRDYDLALLTVTSEMNRIIREVAGGASVKPNGPDVQAAGNASLVDVEATIQGQSPHGIPGQESFIDHIHFTFASTYVAAAAIAKALDGIPPFSESAAAPLPDIDECKTLLAFSDSDRLRELEEIANLCAPPSTQRLSEEAAHDKAVLEKRLAGRDRRQVEAEACERALELREDYHIRARYADLLREMGRRDEAEAQMAQIFKKFPYRF